MKFETLGGLLEESVRRNGSHDVLGTKGKDGTFHFISYRQLSDLVDQARGGLAQLGVGRGDKVAIISNNRVEWVVLAFACYGLGAIYVPMYEAQLASEWEFILKDSEAKVAVGATENIFDELRKIQANLPSVERVIGLDLPTEHESSYAHLLRLGQKNPASKGTVTKDDLASIIYTSGTTGVPKGVCLSHWNFCSNVHGALQRYDFREGDCSLAFLPWAHAFGQTCELYSILGAGAAIAINDAIPNLIQNFPIVRPTVLVAVPRIFNRIYDGVHKQVAEKPKLIQELFKSTIALSKRRRNGERLSLPERAIRRLGDRLVLQKVRARFGGRLRFVVSGSAALSPSVAEFIDALGIDVFEGYGLTETSPVATGNFPGRRKIGTVGLPFPGIQIIIDTSATNDPIHGEILIKGPNVMQGYFKRPEETQAVMMPDGSFRTGDMGFIDADGFLKITGRIKEQYKLENGKYVVPSPLEEELKLSPYIANVMLHGENHGHNVALVVLDTMAVATWASERGLPSTGLERSPEVKRLIQGEIEKYSTEFKGYERPKDLLLVTEDFTTENGMLTPKMSLKRRNVLAKYGSALEALYGN